MAVSECGSSRRAFIRRKVSRQEIPASTRIFVFEVCTTALLPRLPLASTETTTPIGASIRGLLVEPGVTLWLIWTLRVTRAVRFRHILIPRNHVPDRPAHQRTTVGACDPRQKRQQRFVDLSSCGLFDDE